jgi:excisionase family DNA binding protein
MQGMEPQLATENYLTVADVALLLKVSRWTVYELIRTRELASFRVGRCRRIPGSAVRELVAQLTAEAS